MEIVNLNCIRKISLVKKQRTIDFKWIESVTFSQWFKNLFRRKENKLKNRCLCYQMCVFYPESEINNVFNRDNVNYEYDENSDMFFKKAHVILRYSDGEFLPEVRYFNSNKEAEEFFKKLQVFAHDNNIPFINFEIKE